MRTFLLTLNIFILLTATNVTPTRADDSKWQKECANEWEALYEQAGLSSEKKTKLRSLREQNLSEHTEQPIKPQPVNKCPPSIGGRSNNQANGRPSNEELWGGYNFDELDQRAQSDKNHGYIGAIPLPQFNELPSDQSLESKTYPTAELKTQEQRYHERMKNNRSEIAQRDHKNKTETSNTTSISSPGSFQSNDIMGYWKRERDGMRVHMSSVNKWKDGGHGQMYYNGRDELWKRVAKYSKFRGVNYADDNKWICEQLWIDRSGGTIGFYFDEGLIRMSADKTQFTISGTTWTRLRSGDIPAAYYKK